MLSIETPPGPSCPCKALALRTDEKASDQFAFEEADPVGLSETQIPNFSIRDFVFTSRSKDIKTNWPFPQQFLQHCLKNGVRTLLPPFESQDSVRTKCCRKAIESHQPVACSGAENISSQFESLEIKDVGPVDDQSCNIRSKSYLPSDKFVGSSDQAQYLLTEKKQKPLVDHEDISDDEPSGDDAETISAVTNQVQIERISDQTSKLHCSVQVIRSVSEASSEIEAAEPHPVPSELEILRDPSEKKCRLIVKLDTITDTSRTEDVVSTSSTVSDTMASKVCPVCKIFASTSNTTLNAHIDQCLAADSNTMRAVTEIPKLKMKPKKKRLMVDIYATAAHCTLEDLDKRNGTNWVSELALMAPTNEACTEIKRPKLSPVDATVDDKPVDSRDDGNEGSVYVDSNGIKLRILSKFNGTPSVMSREHFKLKKHITHIKEGKHLLSSKKNRFGSKYSKYMKVKPVTKKLSSFKLFNGEVQAAPEEDHHADTYLEKEELPSEILSADQIKCSGSATLTHWVCSKRSDLPKKHNRKDINNLANLKLPTKNLLSDANKLYVGNSSVVKSHVLKFSRPSEDLTTPPKTKRIDFLSNSVQMMDTGKKSPKPPFFNSKWTSESTSTNGLMLKISRSLGTSISPPRSRRQEIQMSTMRRADNSRDKTMATSKSCHPSLKVKNNLCMKRLDLFGRSPSSDGSKGDLNNKLSTSKRLRKHRSIPGTRKQEELPSDVNGGLCRSIKTVGLDAAKTSKTTRSHRSDISEGISRSIIEGIMDQESPTSSNISESEEGDVNTMGKQKCDALKWRHCNSECHGAELATSDTQVETLSCVDIDKPSMEMAVGDPIATEPIFSDSLTPVSNAKSDLRPSVLQSVCGSEAHEEPLAGKTCDEQAMQYCNLNVTCDEVVSRSIQVADELGSRGEVDTCAAQYTECPTKTISIQESSACLTCHRDGVFEIPQENSSITSIRMTSDLDQHLTIDREPSGSPISTASTISPLPKDSKFKGSEAEPFRWPTVQDKSGLAVSYVTGIDATAGRNIERRNQEVQMSALAKESEHFSEDQHCCCSQREGFSRECPFSGPSVMAGSLLPSKEKQISNLYITKSISSSFSFYPSQRTDAMATPIVESPTGSITPKAYTDCSVRASTSIDLSSPSPSPRTQTQSNSILRLMGKNLMVANKEEAEELPMVYHSAPDNPSNTQCLLPPAFATAGWEGFPYHHHQFPGGTTVSGHASPVVSHQIPRYSSNMQAGGFANPLQSSLKMKPEQQFYKLNKKPNSSSAFHMEITSASHQHNGNAVPSSQANMLKEVIEIDDSPEFETEWRCNMPNPVVWPVIPVSNPMQMQQRLFPYVPPQSQFFSRDVTSLRPYPNAYPRDYANSVKQGKASEGSDPLPARPLIFQPPSTGHLNQSFYYSPTFRCSSHIYTSMDLRRGGCTLHALFEPSSIHQWQPNIQHQKLHDVFTRTDVSRRLHGESILGKHEASKKLIRRRF